MQGITLGPVKGDTRCLDYGSCMFGPSIKNTGSSRISLKLYARPPKRLNSFFIKYVRRRNSGVYDLFVN